MNPFKKKTDVESRAASSSEQALCSVCRHAIPESRRELGLCLDCSTKNGSKQGGPGRWPWPAVPLPSPRNMVLRSSARWGRWLSTR